MSTNQSTGRATKRSFGWQPFSSAGLAVILVILTCLLACGSNEVGPPVGQPTAPNIVLILVDALRQDHLGLYGYPRKTSETIDLLGSSGWVFENHIASASQTVPSTLSMMLSQHPAEHGFVHSGPGHFVDNPPYYPDTLNLLAEVLDQSDYATGGFVGNPFLDVDNGFHQGFDRFLNSPNDKKLTRGAVLWLREESERPDRQPFFLYMHYMGVHGPYKPPRRLRHFAPAEGGQLIYKHGLVSDVDPLDLAYTKAMYDGGIVSVDEQVARLLEELDSLGVRDNTVVVLTSDHGDEFLEHGGLGHGTHVFGELVRVPLIVSYPKRFAPGRRIHYLSRHLDLAPTLLEIAGIEKPQSFRGQLLDRAARIAVAENGPWSAVYAQDEKIVHNRETGSLTLFATSDRLDLSPRPATLDNSLWSLLQAYEASSEPDDSGAEREAWTAEELEQLKALGYVAN